MKRILTSALAIVFLVGAASAQGKGKNKEHKERMHGHEMPMKKADLSVQQENQVKLINENYRKQVADLKTQNLSAEQMRIKKEELHKKHVADIHAVLTEEQKAKMATREQWKNKEGRMKGDSSGRKGEKGFYKGNKEHKGHDMAAELNLTADQQAKMTSLRTSYKAKMEALRNDNALTQEQKKEKMKELMKLQKEEMHNILTKEQQEKMNTSRKQNRKRVK